MDLRLNRAARELLV